MYYVAYLCGPTDCFPHAIFHAQDFAVEWVTEQSLGREKGFVRGVSSIEEAVAFFEDQD